MASSKSHQPVHAALAIILVLGSCVAAWAVEFAGGTGEPNDPYQIATAEQLIAISSDRMLFDRHFVLVADIDLDPCLPGRKVFQGPLMQWTAGRLRVAQDSAFHGSFNGGGHVIRNGVFYSASAPSYAGFFYSIAPEGIVRDLHFEDIVIESLAGFASKASCVGILAVNNEGTVVGCSATGTLTAYAGGGLIGRNAGLVSGCHSRCDMFGEDIGGLIGINEATGRVVLCESDGALYGGAQAGGLVATNKGTIQYCTTDGYMFGTRAGGLVGDNSGQVRESFAIATMVMSPYAGGIASTNSGTIVNCHAAGPVSNAYSDGLVATNRGTILSSYSTTASQSNPKLDPPHLRSLGLTGQSGSGDADSAELAALSDVTVAAVAQGTVRCVYYLDPQKPPGQMASPYSGYGVALSPEEMKQASSLMGFDFYGDANDGPAGHWFMPPDGYPVLTWQTQVTGLVGVPDLSGLSPEQARIVLETMGLEMNGVTYDYARPPDGGTTWDVDIRGQVVTAVPVGYHPAGSRIGVVVSLGKYDFSKNAGDGSEANPYQIETPGQLDSLYNQTIPAGRHYILTADIDMSRYAYAGSLIREFSGEFNGNGRTIRAIQTGAASIVYGNAFAPFGLFGKIASSGFVHDLTVYEARAAGGILAGENLGQVLRCKAAGQITGGYSSVGGLVGYNNASGQLTDCRFSGRIRPGGNSTDIGGLVGNNMGAIVRCCACDVDISGGSYVGGMVGENGYATGLIEASYAIGTVQGVDSVGGLVGRNGIPPVVMKRRAILAQAETTIPVGPSPNGVVRGCYAACSVTGQQNMGGLVGSAPVPEAIQESSFFLDPKDGGGPDNGLGTALTASQMKQQASFTAWDFVDTWTICEGIDYPRLKWEKAECTQ